MPFLNVKRTALPTDLTLPVAAQTDGTKAANFFPGWDSPITTVFSSGNPNGFRKVCEANSDGRIAAQSHDLWRDGKITTFAQSVQILGRLTASGRAIVCSYSGNVGGGLLTIDEVSGINPALPILSQNTPRNGTFVRAIYTSAAGGQTMVSRFGPSGTDVVANYSNIYTAGDTLTLILDAFRIAVMWRSTVIVDLPYEGWTLMEAGRWALAPTTDSGVLDSAMDFTPLTVLPSVTDGIPHPSDFSNPAAPVVNAYDFKMRGLRQLCSAGAGSTTVTVANAAAFTPYIGEYFIIEAGTVEMAVTPKAGGNTGNGFMKQPYIPPWGPVWLTGVNGDESHWLEGVYTAVVQPGATTWRLTAPNAEVLGTVPIDNRINSKIYTQMMQGSIPFAAGDSFNITVTCRGETSTATYDGLKAAGRVRTIGVGGTWPAATITAAQLAANQNPQSVPPTTFVRVTDGPEMGINYRRADSGNDWSAPGVLNNFHYGFRCEPMAHKCRLVSVNTGANTITIDVPTVAATSGVYIWHDAWYALQRCFGDEFGPYDNVTVRLPEGNFGFGDKNGLNDRDTWGVRGEGQGTTRLHWPRGIWCQPFHLYSVDSTYMRDFDIVCKDDPMGGHTMQVAGPSIGIDETYGVLLAGTNSWLDNISIYEFGHNAFELNNSFNCQIGGVINPETDPALWRTQRSMCEIHNKYPSMMYRGWKGAMAACSNEEGPCKISGLRIRHAYIYSGVENFGSAFSTMEYCDFENASINSNGSSEATYSHLYSVYKNSSWPNGSVNLESSPMFSANANQPGSTAGTVYMTNCTLIQEGYIDEVTQSKSRTITSDSGTLVMRGTYNPTVADDGNRLGLVKHVMPYVIGTNALNDTGIIVADGGALDVEGCCFDGCPSGGWPYSLQNQNVSELAVVRIVNNVMTAPPADTHTTPVTGNVTKAAYDAL